MQWISGAKNTGDKGKKREHFNHHSNEKFVNVKRTCSLGIKARSDLSSAIR